MHTALQDIKHEVNTRTDQPIQELRQGIYSFIDDQNQLAIHCAEDNAPRVVELVRGILDQYERSTRIRHEQESEALIDRVEERLREVVVVAKTTAETKISEMLEPKIREMLEPKIHEAVALQLKPKIPNTVEPDPKYRKSVELQEEPTCFNIAPVATAAAPTMSRPKSQHQMKTRAQAEKDRQDKARCVERRAQAKLDRIRQEAQVAVSARAATRAAELLHRKPKARARR
ncbi:hypothetical protein PHMEG_00030248 [Phytophthora megakarya]|uniref:Uncharacterized protein n=1 Tax=Phytophthora megakarya TaxID=4795 RepID=A0A225V390_9STRA|nr:hypothetical protein PHMEG_00030248 [Phytophthora megakarya]